MHKIKSQFGCRLSLSGFCEQWRAALGFGEEALFEYVFFFSNIEFWFSFSNHFLLIHLDPRVTACFVSVEKIESNWLDQVLWPLIFQMMTMNFKMDAVRYFEKNILHFEWYLLNKQTFFWRIFRLSMLSFALNFAAVASWIVTLHVGAERLPKQPSFQGSQRCLLMLKAPPVLRLSLS